MTALSGAVWRILQTALWVVLLWFVALLALSRFTPYETLVVRSGSMSPTIPTGSIVVVDRRARVPAIGQVASFRNPDGSLVTHRVVAIENGAFITRGDANASVDPVPRPAATVYGIVQINLPYLGYLVHALEQPAAFLLLLLGSGGFLVLDALRTIRRELARLRQGPGMTNVS